MDKYFKELDKINTPILEHQDWKQIIISTKKKNNTFKHISESHQKDIKIFKQVEDDDLKHKKVPNEIRVKIQQARASLKYTQKQLALKCNLPISVINDIETGKAIYNHKHINKIINVR